MSNLPESGSLRYEPTGCEKPGRYPKPGPRLSWLRRKMQWRARNELVARLYDPTDDLRARWIEQQTGAADPPPDAFAIRGHEDAERASFMVIADTGEGDTSQMAVVPGLLNVARGTRFMVIASDVVYPAGESNDYLQAFYRPYAKFAGPIYAIPGNHDWYDALTGFMVHHCDAKPLAPAPGPRFFRHPVKALARKAWRKAGPVDPEVIAACRALRPPNRPPQRTPYWTLDLPGVRLVALDTGIGRRIDAAQGDWLLRVSRADRQPKILLTGAPIYRNGEHRTCAIEGRTTSVDAIIAAKEHNYKAVIAGELHNYQRYPVAMADGGHPIQHIIAGGGGAFMDPTYQVPNLDRLKCKKRVPVHEVDMKLYPTRGRSLAKLTQELARKRWIFRWIALTDDEAAALIGKHLDLQPVERSAQDAQKRRQRLRARLVTWIFLRPLPGPGKFYAKHVGNYLDWDTPRLYKSFLRVDVEPAQVRIRCFSASGCGEDEEQPPLVDEVAIPL